MTHFPAGAGLVEQDVLEQARLLLGLEDLQRAQQGQAGVLQRRELAREGRHLLGPDPADGERAALLLFLTLGRRLGLRTCRLVGGLRVLFGLGLDGGLLVAPGLLLFLLLREDRLRPDQLDDRQLGAVPQAGPQLEGAGVAARTRREARPESVEQLLHDLLVAHLPQDPPAGVQVVPARQGDQALRERPQLLRLRERGGEPLMAEERGGQVPEQGPAVAFLAAELAVADVVAHATPIPPWASGGDRSSCRATDPSRPGAP